MATKTKRRKQKFGPLSKRTRRVILPIFLVIGAGVVALTALSIIILLPKSEEGAQYGVGADGFRAYVEENGNLGVGSIATKAQVTAALGDKAKSVGDPEVSKVFNMNGDRGQTATYPFVRADGANAHVHIDLRLYKNVESLEKDNIYVATQKTSAVNGHPAYFKLAQTLDNAREYHMIVVNGLKVYRFVFAQPAKKVTVTEVAALATLKRLALELKL